MPLICLFCFLCFNFSLDLKKKIACKNLNFKRPTITETQCWMYFYLMLLINTEKYYGWTWASIFFLLIENVGINFGWNALAASFLKWNCFKLEGISKNKKKCLFREKHLLILSSKTTYILGGKLTPCMRKGR